jgi:predicted nucleic acid-binding protein
MNDGDEVGPFFLDTNVLVYSFDDRDPRKQSTARQLISTALHTQRGMISTQVVQEFLNVALRRFAHPLTVSESRELLAAVLMPLCRHQPSIGFYDRALLLREQAKYAFYDALIVSAAVESGCKTLFTEDLDEGRTIQGLRIVNPFRE